MNKNSNIFPEKKRKGRRGGEVHRRRKKNQKGLKAII